MNVAPAPLTVRCGACQAIHPQRRVRMLVALERAARRAFDHGYAKALAR